MFPTAVIRAGVRLSEEPELVMLVNYTHSNELFGVQKHFKQGYANRLSK